MNDDFRSSCPLASALDLVGDKWSLVVIRDLFVGKTRYGEFLASPERISTNILADRLEMLTACGIISREAADGRPGRPRYRLTRKGADLLPVLQALAGWALVHLPERWNPGARFAAARPEAFYPEGEKAATDAGS